MEFIFELVEEASSHIECEVAWQGLDVSSVSLNKDIEAKRFKFVETNFGAVEVRAADELICNDVLWPHYLLLNVVNQ